MENKTIKQLWAIIKDIEQEIPYIKHPLPYIDHIADIYLSWQRKDYKEFREQCIELLFTIKY